MKLKLLKYSFASLLLILLPLSVIGANVGSLNIKKSTDSLLSSHYFSNKISAFDTDSNISGLLYNSGNYTGRLSPKSIILDYTNQFGSLTREPVYKTEYTNLGGTNPYDSVLEIPHQYTDYSNHNSSLPDFFAGAINTDQKYSFDRLVPSADINSVSITGKMDPKKMLLSSIEIAPQFQMISPPIWSIRFQVPNVVLSIDKKNYNLYSYNQDMDMKIPDPWKNQGNFEVGPFLNILGIAESYSAALIPDIGILGNIAITAGTNMISTIASNEIKAAAQNNFLGDPEKYFNIKNSNILKINLENFHLQISNKDKIEVSIPDFNIHARIGWWMKHSEVSLDRLFVKLNFKNA